VFGITAAKLLFMNSDTRLALIITHLGITIALCFKVGFLTIITSGGIFPFTTQTTSTPPTKRGA